MTTPDPVSWEALEARIVARASKEPDYRAALLADPRKVIHEEIVKAIPNAKPASSRTKINVIEAGDDEVYLILPKAAGQSGTLRDEELETVSGGIANTTTVCKQMSTNSTCTC
jgi:hypothetical protein